MHVHLKSLYQLWEDVAIVQVVDYMHLAITWLQFLYVTLSCYDLLSLNFSYSLGGWELHLQVLGRRQPPQAIEGRYAKYGVVSVTYKKALTTRKLTLT